jgi:hypothetical protein
LELPNSGEKADARKCVPLGRNDESKANLHSLSAYIKPFHTAVEIRVKSGQVAGLMHRQCPSVHPIHAR